MDNISINLAKKIVDSINKICGYNINFINKQGIIIASTNQERINTFHQAGLNAIKSKSTIIVDDNNFYLGAKKGINTPIFINEEPIAVIGVTGEPKEIEKYIFLAIKITEIFLAENLFKENLSSKIAQISYITQTYLYKQTEKYHHTQEILKKLNINQKINYCAITIILNETYNLNNIKLIEKDIELFFNQCNCPLKTYIYPFEFVGFLPEDNLKLLNENLENFSKSYKNILKIGIGNFTNLENIRNSYENSMIAISSIKNEKNFKYYEDFSLEILLNSIPKELKQKYIKNIVSKLKDEEIHILKVYFEHNMELKNTANDLFIHTNTLQYKLDKINKKIGFNPRTFKDASYIYFLISFF